MRGSKQTEGCRGGGRRYDQTPFIKAQTRSFSFYPRSLPICSTCFYLGGPRATPPWPDVDHWQLHNGDCVHTLNDRPVLRSGKDPSTPPLSHPSHTNKKQLDCITGFLFWKQCSMFHKAERHDERFKEWNFRLLSRNVLSWKPHGGFDNRSCLVLCGRHDDLLLIMFILMSYWCLARRLISVPLPLVIDFPVFIVLFI